MKRAQRVGRYHVLDCVGTGGMAEVYRSKYLDAAGSERLVALKRVLEMYSDDDAFIRMLVAEYQLSSLLVHANIAEVYELLRTPEGYFVVMEYVDGKDLRSTLLRGHERGKPLDVADAVYLMARAVDGLAYAHVATTPDGRPLQLVHRDFSPSNILIGYDGSVKIIDFGIAKANVDRDRTAVGIIKGKVRYMSPEQANGDRALTGQSDVFSAGSVLYEILTGQAAFHAASEIELIYTVRRAEPVPLRTLAPTVPDALATIVETAMARLRRDRYPSGAAFRDALVTFLRAYAPGYRRTRLANRMRSLWVREIDRELRALLEYAMSDAPESESENLLESASIEQSIQDARGPLRSDDLFASEILGRFESGSRPRVEPPSPDPKRTHGPDDGAYVAAYDWARDIHPGTGPRVAPTDAPPPVAQRHPCTPVPARSEPVGDGRSSGAPASPEGAMETAAEAVPSPDAAPPRRTRRPSARLGARLGAPLGAPLGVPPAPEEPDADDDSAGEVPVPPRHRT